MDFWSENKLWLFLNVCPQPNWRYSIDNTHSVLLTIIFKWCIYIVQWSIRFIDLTGPP